MKDLVKYNIYDLVKNPLEEYEDVATNITYRYNEGWDQFEFYVRSIGEWRRSEIKLDEMFKLEFTKIEKTYNTAEAFQMIYEGKTMISADGWMYRLVKGTSNKIEQKRNCDWCDHISIGSTEYNGQWTEYIE